jgi:ATP-dependent DNA helicase RecQ
MALTATAPDEVYEDIAEQLQLREPVVERVSVDRPNIHFSVIKCRNKKEKRSQLLRVALAHEGQPGIVYCTTRNDAESTSALLKSHGFSARHYHAGMPAEQRQAVQEMFMSDQVQVICATNAFGLGVDKPDIGFVVHWSLPLSLDAYFQEAGRAARDSRLKGSSVLIWAPSDLTLLRRMAASSLPSLEELQKLDTEISRLPVPYATIDDLSETTGLDDVSTRVGIHILEQAGALAQGSDVAARAFVAVPSSIARLRERFGDEIASEVEELVAASDLSAPGRAVINVVELAAELEVDASELEQRLLGLAEKEAVGYRPFLRAMSIQSMNIAWDTAQAEDTLRRLRRSSFDRLAAMKVYAEKETCRRAQILQHFDEEVESNCGFCDMCVGEPEHLADIDPSRYAAVDVVTDQVAQAIVGIVREASRLGSKPGRGSFVKGLRGTRKWATFETPEVLQRSRWFGSLRYLTETEINEAIDTMLDRGQILAIEQPLSSGGTYTGLDVRL